MMGRFKFLNKKKLVILVTLIILGLWLYSSLIKGKVWVAANYTAEGVEVNRYEFSPEFKTKDECRNWVQDKINKDQTKNSGWWCGLNCDKGKFGPDYCQLMENY